MLKRFKNAVLYDPASGLEGTKADLWVDEGCFTAAPKTPGAAAETIDLEGLIVMAGAIDLHTHIGGGKVNIARQMLPELVRASRNSHGEFFAGSVATGHRYAALGYTTCFEPAVLPYGARHAHFELADTPVVDTGGYALLGNDDLLLQMLADRHSVDRVADYVAWTLHATQCMGIKVVNAGAINAFTYDRQLLDVDAPHPRYGVTPRDVIATLTAALDRLQVPHPLHVHCSNLGVAGNADSTLKTIHAAAGHRIHLTHLQFHSYGDDGPKHFSSRAAQIADVVNRNPNVSVDVGQVIFGQTVTISADLPHQSAARRHARPRRWALADLACQAGCGVVPFRYRDTAFVHSLQWAIGLELFLMIDDPSRIYLTTDHPNGGPFTSYPHLIRLLTDRTFRNEQLERIHPDAAAASSLRGMDREYTLGEIAAMTRSGPAAIVGLHDRGRLAPGYAADFVAYRPNDDHEQMFAVPRFVYKGGQLIAENGRVVGLPPKRTHTVRPQYDARIVDLVDRHHREYLGTTCKSMVISDDELATEIGSEPLVHPCLNGRS